MNARNRFTFFGLIVLLALIASLAVPAIARADGAPPPPPASPSGSDASANSSVAPVTTLSQVPADTTVVAVNKKGRAEPLATQAAAKIVDTGDPIWCPSGTAPIPGIGGCTASYSNLASLIDDINGSVIPQPAANGIIWINAGPDSSSSDIFIDGTSLTTWADYALTLQGGWNGSSAGSVTGNSSFSKQIAVLNWNNDVTVNDISISGAASVGLAVWTNGDIVVHHVTSSNNESGASLYNDPGGSILVSSSVFNANGYYGLFAGSAGDITLNNVIANQNPGIGVYAWSKGDTTFNNVTANDNGPDCHGLTSCTNPGAGIMIYSQGPASLTDITANRNMITGVYVGSEGDITLNNVIADYNWYGAELYPTLSENPNIVVNNSSFNYDTEYGLLAFSMGNITLNNIEAIGNRLYGARLWIEGPDGSVFVNCGHYNHNGNNIEGAGIFMEGPSLTLNGVDLSGNRAPYNYNNGTPKFGSAGCGGSSDDRHISPGLPLHKVNVTGDEANGLDCTQYSGTELILPNHDSALIPCPVGDSASLGALTSDSLPGTLPGGDTYISAFITGVTKNGASSSPVNGPITVSFAVPDNMKNANLAILVWDGSQWVEVPGGHMTADGHFEALTNLTGTFVLVSK